MVDSNKKLENRLCDLIPCTLDQKCVENIVFTSFVSSASRKENVFAGWEIFLFMNLDNSLDLNLTVM